MNPSSLYKYVPFNVPEECGESDLQSLRLKGFENGKIWCPTAYNLNDPYECYPKFEIKDEYIKEVVDSLTPDEFILIKKDAPDVSKENLKRVLKDHKDPLRRALICAVIGAVNIHNFKKIGVLSLTTDPLNLIMWAHYGGNSKGVCLEFERTPDNELGSARTLPVKYLKARPEILFQDRNRKKVEIVTSKFEGWEYEQEWRNWQETGEKLYPFPGKLIGVIFGLDCHEETKKVVKKTFGSTVEYEDTYLGRDYKLHRIKSI